MLFFSDHSTESALLAVHGHIVRSMDEGKLTALVLPALSAAFHTVDTLLVHRLQQHWFGVSGLVVNWFTT